MFSRDSENGVTLELEFLQTPCIRQFFTRQIHLEKRFVKIFRHHNLRYMVLETLATVATTPTQQRMIQKANGFVGTVVTICIVMFTN